jgi:integrase
MSIKFVNGKYQVTVRDRVTRKETQRTFRLKGEAEQFKAEAKKRNRAGQALIRESRETVAERCNAWLEARRLSGGFRFATLLNNKTHIEKYIIPELGTLRVQALTIKDCEDAALVWKTRTSGLTANAVLKILTTIFDEALRHRVIEFNPAEKALRVKVTTEDEDDGEVQPEDVYNATDLAALVAASEPGTPTRILVWLGGFCGLRIGEILGFSWAAIDLKAASPVVRVIKNLVPETAELADFPGYIDGRALKDPKKKSRRALDAPRELVRDLRLWKLRCPAARPREWPGGDPLAKQLVMLTVEGKPYHRATAQQMFDEVADRAKIARRSLHRLRHTFASLLLQAGVPLQKVSTMLGHRDISITARVYAHFIEDGINAVQSLTERVLASSNGKRESE